MNKSDLLLDQAEKFFKSSHIEKSIEKSLKSLSLDKSFKAYNLLSIAYIHNNDYENSLKYSNEGLTYLSSLQQSEKHIEKKFRLFLCISKAYKLQKDYKNSLKSLQECLNLGYNSDLVNKYIEVIQGFLHQSEEYKAFEAANRNYDPALNEKFFIVKASWLNAWKNFQCGVEETHPGDLKNSSLIDFLSDEYFVLDRFEETKFILKPEMKEEKDFKILTKASYEIVTKGISVDYEICRYSHQINNSNEMQVEVFFPKRKLKVLGLECKIPSKYFFISKTTLVADLKNALIEVLTPKLSLDFTDDKAQIWKFPESFKLSKQGSNTKIYYPDCSLLNESLTLEENKVAPDEVLLIEFQRINDAWTIIKNTLQKCERCSNTDNLKACSYCKKVKYCSTACQKSDLIFHRNKCVQKPQIISKQGKVGLQNLGNTCFMNSGLQCLSSCELLSEYFISKSYVPDLNTDNPLGTKGAQLAIKYAELIRELWDGKSSVVSPWDFKACLSRFATQFSGYQQHDSQEFLSFLLSGLHEDLNRVKKKVYIETPEQGNMTEQEYSNVMWKWFLNRNQSIIVDLLYGQHKSTVICPCSNVSITFDPFLMLSAVLPNFGVLNTMVFLTGKKPIQLKLEIGKFETFKVARMKLEEMFNCRFAGYFMDKLKFAGFIHDDQMIGNLKSSVLMFNQIISNAEDYEIIPLNIVKAGEKGKYVTQKSPASIPRLICVKKNEDSLSIFEQVKIVLGGVYSDSKIKVPESYEEHLESPLFSINTCKKKSFCDLCKTKCEGCSLSLSTSLKISDLSKMFSELNQSRIILEAEIDFKQHLTSLNQWETGPSINLNKNSKLDIQRCIELASYPEILDEENKWYCKECKEHVRATKQYKVYKFPKILIIHLLRFKKKGLWTEKITDLVDFPVENLILDSISEQGVKFNLFAISNHYGGTGGGHYTAFIKKQDGWYEMDDSRVSKTDASSIVTSGAYLLFYEKLNA